MKKLLLLLSLLCVGQILSAQTITGTISDDTGEPLIGSTILVQGLDGIGAATDIDGTFSIDVPELPVFLEISYPGYTDLVLEIAATEELEVELSQSLTMLSCWTVCNITCGPSRGMLIGPSRDVLNQSSGISAGLELPRLLKVNSRVSIHGTWNFTNDVSDFSLRAERYDMPRIGRLGTSLVGKYRRIDNTNVIDLDLKIIGPQFFYRGFELMVGYAHQKQYNLSNDPAGAKNTSNDSSIDRKDGVHVELSKYFFRIFFQSELTYFNGISQHETKAEYWIPRTDIKVKASYGSINGYQSAVVGATYRFGL